MWSVITVICLYLLTYVTSFKYFSIIAFLSWGAIEVSFIIKWMIDEECKEIDSLFGFSWTWLVNLVTFPPFFCLCLSFFRLHVFACAHIYQKCTSMMSNKKRKKSEVGGFVYLIIGKLFSIFLFGSISRSPPLLTLYWVWWQPLSTGNLLFI